MSSLFLNRPVWKDLGILFLSLGKVVLPLSLFFLYVWQNVQVARLNREIGIATGEKIKQIKKTTISKSESPPTLPREESKPFIEKHITIFPSPWEIESSL